jgi:hypothetical protein
MLKQAAKSGRAYIFAADEPKPGNPFFVGESSAGGNRRAGGSHT